ncbi:MAG: DUF6056 family protein [Lachnospiraceae bacterium]|nr:DUF6056 family protein [Lachnospiraceae bacterium]
MSIAIIVFVIATFIMESSYTVLVGDDFWYNQPSLIEVGIGKYLLHAFNWTKKMYMSWQGTFFAFFVHCITDPVNSNGAMLHLRIQMICMTLIFWISFCLYLYSFFMKNTTEKKELKWCLICLCVLLLGTTTVFTEIFSWRTGAIAYMLPMTMCFIALSLYYQIKNYSVGIYVLMILLTFLASGGSLTVSAFNCTIWLMMVAYQFLSEKRISVQLSVFFVSSFLGAVFNTIAPGNFQRQVAEQYSLVSNFINVIQDTWRVFISNEIWFLFRRDSLLFLFAIGCLGYWMKDSLKISKKSYIILSFIFIFTPLIAIFPVILGYGVPWIPQRCVFVVTVMMVLAWGNIFWMIGTLIPSINIAKIGFGIGIIFTLVVIFTNQATYKDMALLRLNYCLVKGQLPTYYREFQQMLEYLETREGEDVILTEEHYPKPIEYAFCFELYDDPDSSVNLSLSRVYGLKSLVLSEEIKDK